MKKIIILFMLVTVFMRSNTNYIFVYGENSTNNNTDIIITEHNGFEKNFYEKSPQNFNLKFTLENHSNNKLKDIYIQIEDNDSFKPEKEGSKIFLQDIIEKDGKIIVGSSGSKEYIQLKYSGGTTSKIPVKIYYKKMLEENEEGQPIYSEELYITEYIGVNVVLYEEPIKEEPKDTSKYVPVLSIYDSSVNTLEAGTTKNISFTVKNNSDYSAENITISATIADGDSPFTIESLGSSEFISRIRSEGKDSFSLRLTTDINAKEKSYPIKIKYQFYNKYDDLFTSEETIYLKVINKSMSPKLYVDSIKMPDKEIEPGDKIDIGFFIKNIGTLDAKNINAHIEGLKNDSFFMANTTNKQYKDLLAGNKLLYISYTLNVSNKIEGGAHNLDLKLQYEDLDNNGFEDSYQFFINVKGKDEKPSNLFIENITTPNNDILVGEDFNIKFNLKNDGIGEAKNIKVFIETGDEIIPKSPSVVKIQKIMPKETKPIEFTLNSTNEATTKNYPISINIEYEDDAKEDGKQVLNQYVGVYIEKDGEGSSSIPKIIIDQYNFNPNIVKAGENFDLNISFLNTNKTKAIQNIKVFLTVDEETEKSGSVFTPVNSSNTFYIDYIAPKSRIEKNIVMYTVPDAKPKTYTITANFEYEDLDGNEYKPTELIGIPVVQQSKLETTNINVPAEAFIGEMIPISLELYNMGKVTLTNLMVKTEGNFETENANYFIGNFDAGNSEYYEAMIIPTEPGLLEGKVIFSYEDSDSETVEIVKDFSINIIEMPMEEFPPEDFNPEMQQGGKSQKIVISIIFIIILAIVTFIIVRKKMIKKKGMALDE